MKSGRDKSSEVKTTGALLSKIFATKNIKNFLSRNEKRLNTPALSEYLTELCADKGVKPNEAIKSADIDKSYGLDVFSGRRANPSRNYVLRLALALKLTFEECQKLLAVAKHSALYARIPRDAIIIHCLHNKLDFNQTQEKLHEFQATLL